MIHLKIRKDKRVICVNPKYENISQWINKSIDKFDNVGVLFSKRRNTLRILTTNEGVCVIVKRYILPGAIQTIVYSFFRKSKASRAFIYSEYLLLNGIETPVPVAYVEEYHNWLFRYGYYMSLYKKRETCWILNSDLSNQKLIYALALYISRMHECGFLHGDVNLSNFLYEMIDGEYVICTVDTNRSKIIHNPTLHQCLANLRRISHESETIMSIVSEYAKIREWPVSYCVHFVLDEVKKLERRKKIQNQFKISNVMNVIRRFLFSVNS